MFSINRWLKGLYPWYVIQWHFENATTIQQEGQYVMNLRFSYIVQSNLAFHFRLHFLNKSYIPSIALPILLYKKKRTSDTKMQQILSLPSISLYKVNFMFKLGRCQYSFPDIFFCVFFPKRIWKHPHCYWNFSSAMIN